MKKYLLEKNEMQKIAKLRLKRKERKEQLRKSKKIAMLAAIIMVTNLILGNITVLANSNTNRYVSDTEKITTPDGKKLYSHTENQKFGTISGKSRKVKFYVYAKYEGNTKVNSIKCQWKIGAKLRCEATTTAVVGITGNTYSAQATESSKWQNVTTEEKYWLHTSGTKVSYEDSNFVISPDSDLCSLDFWINTTATVKLKGYAKSSSITSST